MKLFCHINEFGSVGYKSIIPMLFVPQRLVLWAPSGWKFDKLAHWHGVDSAFLLELIDRGRVTVVAREQWLESAKTRGKNSFWSGTPWRDGFDEQLSIWARKDESLPAGQRRVIIAQPEAGWAWARRQAASQSKHFKTAKSLLEQGLLPVGTLSKARRFAQDGEEEKAIEVVLRNAKNHEDAKKLVGADATMELARRAVSFPVICGSPANKLVAHGDVNRAAVNELLEFIAKITPRHSHSYLRKVLFGAEHAMYQREIARYFTAEEPVNEIRKMLSSQEAAPSVLEALTPSYEPFNIASFLTGTLATALSFGIDPSGILGGISFAAGCIGLTRFSERWSLVKAPRYSGDKWIFLLANKTSKPTHAQIAAMIKKTRTMLSRQ